MQDVLIIGGGVIGLSLAFELSGQGVSCAVLDQSGLGQEASWAGEGILPAGNLEFARTPEARLRAASHALWPELSQRLREETGIDNGFVRCGGLEVRCDGPPHALDEEMCAWREEGVQVEPLDAQALAACEPSLSAHITAAYRWPQMGQVRNPRHIKALIAGCAGRGVQFLCGNPVYGFQRLRERISSVQAASGPVPAEKFVLTAGAWSATLLAGLGCTAAVRPRRGQIVLLNCQPSPIRQVVNVGTRYLVPRGDGRILVGSTEEIAGFDKRTTAEAIAGLIDFAIGIVPQLAGAAVERTWAGLRPESADGLPYLGRVPGVDNLFVAAGHFRAGVQLSPITAKLLAQSLLNQPTAVPIEPYAVNRPRRSDDWATSGGGC